MAKFTGSRAFVVEDETLVLFGLEDVLTDLGCEVVAQAMRLDQAVAMAETLGPVDVAILDVNIGGTTVFPVAQILKERGVPLILRLAMAARGCRPSGRAMPLSSNPIRCRISSVR